MGLFTYFNPFSKRRLFTVFGSIFPDSIMILIFVKMVTQGKLDLNAPWFPQLFSQPNFFVLNSAWHSLTLWTILLIIAMTFQWVNLQWFVYGTYFHIGIDIITHKYFVLNYFWPINLPTIYGLLDYRTLGFTIGNILLLIGYVIWRYFFQKNDII